MTLNFRARLAKLFRRETVTVQPRLRVPTYAAFEEVCLLTGLDPDDIRRGRMKFKDAEIEDVYETGARILEITCENPSSLDLDDQPPHLAQELVACVTASFFDYALATFSAQKDALRTTLAGPVSTRSQVPALIRPSVAWPPATPRTTGTS